MSTPVTDSEGGETPERSSRVWVLFDQAADLSPAEQQALLDAACADAPELRAEVERLLANDARLAAAKDSAFLESPLIRAASEPPREPAAHPAGELPLPSQLGRYCLIRLLGEGGMGTVYEAEQDSPRRIVALKVIRAGLASPALLKRFLHESQILGRLHHPGIAQVHEAGLADNGQPFFAMEFIRGLPLDDYARLRALPERLELLARVCDAVQHAHDQDVIHRDLKPANILVEENGQPKVLDFGVARATDADLLTGAGLTRTGQLLGTPSYMSPEQLAADPAAIDHRADVYALGVILFELAVHRLPYQLENRPLAEAARRILDEDPPRLGSLNPELRGDVETIVAKAMEKEPARRYSSAADLAADIRRHLGNEPIQAKPASTIYLLRKFVRRNKTLVSGVTGVICALVAGLIGTLSFAIREAEQRGRAEDYARRADIEKQAALYQAYRASLAAATAALENRDVANAARHLESAPSALRGWEWRHLHSRLDESSAVMPWAAGENGFLIASPDRLRIGVSTSAGLRLMDLEGGEQTTLPLGPEYRRRVHVVTQTRRGLRIAAWDVNTDVELLDETGRVLCRVGSPNGKLVSAFALSPDGTRMACSWSEGERPIVVFDATSGKQTATCQGHRRDIWNLAFSPDGSQFASVGDDPTVRLWDVASGTLLAACQGHTAKLHSVAFSPDGSRLVTTSSDQTVRQWSTQTGKEIEPPYDRHAHEAYSAVYSPDGQWVASAGADRTIRVWRARGRQDLATLHGHTGRVVEVAFAPDGRRLASLSRQSFWVEVGDDTVRVWDVDPRATLPMVRGHTQGIYPVARSMDSRWLASGGWEKTVRVWDAATGEPCVTLQHPSFVLDLAFGPDGTWLVTAGNEDDRLWIWDVATARIRKEIPLPHRNIYSLTISPDGTRVAATAKEPNFEKYRLIVCDIASSQSLFSCPGWSLAYSPDGRWLAIQAADNKTVLLLDARTHETTARFSGHENTVFKAAFSADSRILATCSRDRTIRLWQLDSGECRVLRGHTDEVFAVAFHPEGARLATAGRDGAISLWDLERGEEVSRLPWHKHYVWSLVFSPDGATLASGSGDNTVGLWDTAPLKVRYQARREAAVLRPQAERLVEQLWHEKGDLAEVVAALRANREVSEALRHAALRVVQRRAQPPQAASDKTRDPP